MSSTEEAKLLGYTLLYNRAGHLITERSSVDIRKLKKYFTDEEYSLLKSVIREGKVELDSIHNKIEANLNARKMKD